MQRIRSIPTLYNGYHFRSRLEARWAVFFDHLSVPYRYEHEGFELSDGTYYLPDFYLPTVRTRKGQGDPYGPGTWVEIKGDEPTEGEIEKCSLLAHGRDEPVILFSGLPSEQFLGPDEHKGPPYKSKKNRIDGAIELSPYGEDQPMVTAYDGREFSIEFAEGNYLNMIEGEKERVARWQECEIKHSSSIKRLNNSFGPPWWLKWRLEKANEHPRILEAMDAAKFERFEWS